MFPWQPEARVARDNFSTPTKEALAKRVGLRCSNPMCRAPTTGPHSESTQFVNLGVACHITAASPGGPRYDDTMSPVERGSIDNAIWLCQSCAKLIDSDQTKYTVSALITWRLDAEAAAERALIGPDVGDFYPQPSRATHSPIPKIYGLPYDDARTRLIGSGWQPLRHHWSHGSELSLHSGNGRYFWEKGYHEIENASGTGLAQCTFLYRDVYGTELVVITAGEAIPELGANACVWNWSIRD